MHKYTCVVLMNFSHLGWLPSRITDQLAKQPNANMKKSFFELLARVVKETSKT